MATATEEIYGRVIVDQFEAGRNLSENTVNPAYEMAEINSEAANSLVQDLLISLRIASLLQKEYQRG